MTLETCVARAIHEHLDICEAMPEVYDVPTGKLEQVVEDYIEEIDTMITEVVQTKGDKYIRCKDAAGLCATCLEHGVNVPPAMLLKMCRAIVSLKEMDAKWIMDLPEGNSLYHVKLAIV